MTENEIKEIARRIGSQISPRRLVLFGSMAGGSPGPDSDIDLCVVQDQVADRIAEAIKIREVIGFNLIPMDILVMTRDEYDRRKDIFGTVQYEIDKKGTILYERRD